MQKEQEISGMIESNRLAAVYAYTPLCGTCQLAGKMVEVAEKIARHFAWGRLDVNYHEEFAIRYGVESVPCLLIFQEGQLMEKIYAFQSVPYIYEKLNQYT